MPTEATVYLNGPPAPGRKSRRRRKVVVRTLTLGRFIAALSLAANRIGEFVARTNGWDFGRWILSWTPEDRLNLLAIACPDERASVLQPYATHRNVGRVLEALAETNDVQRLLSAVNCDPQAARSNGSIDADIVALCQRFPGLTPPEVRAWPMVDFLDACEGIEALHTALYGAGNARPPASKAELGLIPGVGVN